MYFSVATFKERKSFAQELLLSGNKVDRLMESVAKGKKNILKQ